jgi:hypothetical protein
MIICTITTIAARLHINNVPSSKYMNRFLQSNTTNSKDAFRIFINRSYKQKSDSSSALNQCSLYVVYVLSVGTSQKNILVSSE